MLRPWHMLAFALPPLVVGCLSDDKDGDSVRSPDTDADGDTDSDGDADGDTDPDGDTDGDTDPEPAVVSVGYGGVATVSPGSSWEGYEDYYITDDETGADYCRARWTAASTTVATGCADCDWAFAVDLTSPEVVTECDRLAGGLSDFQVNYGSGSFEYPGTSYDMLWYGGADGAWSYVALATFDGSNFTYDWSCGASY